MSDVQPGSFELPNPSEYGVKKVDYLTSDLWGPLEEPFEEVKAELVEQLIRKAVLAFLQRHPEVEQNSPVGSVEKLTTILAMVVRTLQPNPAVREWRRYQDHSLAGNLAEIYETANPGKRTSEYVPFDVSEVNGILAEAKKACPHIEGDPTAADPFNLARIWVLEVILEGMFYHGYLGENVKPEHPKPVNPYMVHMKPIPSSQTSGNEPRTARKFEDTRGPSQPNRRSQGRNHRKSGNGQRSTRTFVDTRGRQPQPNGQSGGQHPGAPFGGQQWGRDPHKSGNRQRSPRKFEDTRGAQPQPNGQQWGRDPHKSGNRQSP